MNNISDRELEERAIRAHLRFCHNNGFIVDQPSTDNTIVRGSYVIVANSYRELGRYLISKPKVGKVSLRRV